jgi:hypothetical protein
MYGIHMCLCAFKSHLSGLKCTVQCEAVEYADWLDSQVILRNILIVQHMFIFSDGGLIIMIITLILLYILMV